jgi:hypothetical protein
MIDPASFRIAARSIAPSANGTFSTWLAGQLLNHAFVATMSYVPAPVVYVGLFTTAPTPAGGGTEVAGDPNYARQSIVFSAASGAPAGIQNTAQVEWLVATIDWGAIQAAALFDQVTGGNLLAYGLLLTPDGTTPAAKLVQAGDVFLINPNAFSVGLI